MKTYLQYESSNTLRKTRYENLLRQTSWQPLAVALKTVDEVLATSTSILNYLGAEAQA